MLTSGDENDSFLSIGVRCLSSRRFFGFLDRRASVESNLGIAVD